MARPTSTPILLDEDDLTPLEAVAADLAGTGGWVNLRPVVEPGAEPPPRNPVLAIFSARGNPVPLATWKAAEEPGGKVTVGIEHGAGPKALDRLAEAGLDRPAGSFRVADHSRRGLVLTVPDSTPDADVIWWLLTACHVLSPVPLTGAWQASVYRT